MRLKGLDIPEHAPEDIVQFIKHLEENLDPDDECPNCEVWIETVRESETSDLPGKGIPTRGTDPEINDVGVHVEMRFRTGEDTPHTNVSTLADGFFGFENYVLYGSYDGGKGRSETYVFMTE